MLAAVAVNDEVRSERARATIKDAEVWERPTGTSKVDGLHKDYLISACQRSPYVRAFIDENVTMVAPKANETHLARAGTPDWTLDFQRRILEMEREVSALLSGETTDDSDLLAELDAMAAPVLDLPAARSSLPAAPVGLPAAPSSVPAAPRRPERVAVPA